MIYGMIWRQEIGKIGCNLGAILHPICTQKRHVRSPGMSGINLYIMSGSLRFRSEKIRYPPSADLPDEEQAIANHEIANPRLATTGQCPPLRHSVSKSVETLSSFHIRASSNRARSFFSTAAYASLPSNNRNGGFCSCVSWMIA